MGWMTIAKEVEKQGFRVGLDKIVKDFKFIHVQALLVGFNGVVGQCASVDWCFLNIGLP